jgi:hypothetical protein
MSAAKDVTKPRPSFMGRLWEIAEAARRTSPEDPWMSRLRRLKGHVGHDGVERVSTHHVFDVLEVPMRQRAGKTVRLSRLMHQVGWSNIRARGLNPGGYRDLRGYAREVQTNSPPRDIHHQIEGFLDAQQRDINKSSSIDQGTV